MKEITSTDMGFCDECGERAVLVHLGDEYEYMEASYTVVICKKCLIKALSLLED